MEKPFLEAGQIVGTHGVRGEVKIHPWCDSPDFLCGFATLYLDGQGKTALRAKQLRAHKNIVLGLFDGVDTMEKAQALRGKTVYIDRADTALPDGQWFVQDLLGCKVTDVDSGAEYGKISEVIPGNGANDVWAVKRPGGETVLMPAIRDVVLKTDVTAGIVRIRPLRGLFDGEAQEVRDAD